MPNTTTLPTSTPTKPKRTRSRPKRAVIKGALIAEVIPAKKGAFRVHHPIISLEFKIDGGGTLQLFCRETENANKIFDHFKDSFTTEAPWIKPLTTGAE